MTSGLDFLTPDEEDEIGQRANRLVHQDKQFQINLRNARKKSGLTIEQVAERMGVSPGSVAEFEAYWYDPRMSQIRRYALAIGVDYQHILQGKETLYKKDDIYDEQN